VFLRKIAGKKERENCFVVVFALQLLGFEFYLTVIHNVKISDDVFFEKFQFIQVLSVEVRGSQGVFINKLN
jgi:hypothetical protein